MLYNTGDWRKLAKENSLFDAQTTMNYLDNLSEYPIKFEFCVSVFSTSFGLSKWDFLYFYEKLQRLVKLNRQFGL